MAARDWFRNEDWNSTIEEEFFKKLRRSRGKAQHLCIQAGHLADTHPEAALMLVQQYLARKDEEFYEGHLSRALHNQGRAFLALNRVDEAVQSFQQALEQERKYPLMITTAWSDFCLLVATQGLQGHFEEALKVLAERRSQLVFPLDRFQWLAAHALIRAAQGDREAAKEHAIQALNVAQAEHSGFRYHPRIGLVGAEEENLREKMLALAHSIQ
jgi:tetratricopeptide (TPR) repeat protein